MVPHTNNPETHLCRKERRRDKDYAWVAAAAATQQLHFVAVKTDRQTDGHILKQCIISVYRGGYLAD